ncbi:myosin heavy chain, skeletal muscle-like isoform X2 [Zingiber officinale]|uniref:myosin heavy chain, skeletal muscle-like isoform X2 n=1 Tax=Zingiber officinale TaxID=94328 RepID=UPI001C4CAC32|nr:myosin heavy chain, skeletal muscle-like isoform X2 [Zingiber officinale]
MTADASEFSVGSGVEIEGSVGLGLESDSDQKVSWDSIGIDCLVGEEKVSGRTGRLITMENGNLEESRQRDLDPDVKEDSVAVGDLEPIEMKRVNGELTSENEGDRDGSVDPIVKVSVIVDDDCKDITTCDMEEELVESDLGTVSKEEIGEALQQSVQHEAQDEKVRDIKSGICELEGKRCNEEGNMELCMDNGQDHVKDNSRLEAAKLDFHVEVTTNQEGETLAKDMDFENEESNAEVNKDSNALVTTIGKDMDFENEESNAEVSKDSNSLVTTIDKDMDFENEESNVEVSKDTNALGAPIDKDKDFEKEESNVEVRKDSSALVTTIDKQGNLELSVYDDESQQCESIVIETQHKESKTSSVESNNEESKEVLNNIHHEKEEGTLVRADEKQEITISNTEVDNQADRYTNVLLLEMEESQTVLTAPNKHDQEKLIAPETQVFDNKEQETLELATAEEGSVEETQTSKTYAGNQCELVSAVKIQKEEKLEGLVTESQPHECSVVNEHMAKPMPEEHLEENRKVDGSVSFETHMDVPVTEISGKVDEAVPSGNSIGDILIVEQSHDLHSDEDCCRSDISCVAEVKSSLEIPISPRALPDSGNGSSNCQDTCPSEHEVVTSNAVDVPSITDRRDKLGKVESDNGSCTTETNENAAVNDVDAIKSEFSISKESEESSPSLAGSVEVKRLLDDERKGVNGESGILEESQVPVKEHNASTLAVEKVTTSLGRPQACYIVKIPRSVDNQLSASIQTAQSEVNEKTQRRDSIKVSIEKQKVICNEFWKKFEDEKAEDRTARAAVSAKRQQMESLQLMLNKLKNVQSIEELDAKIQSMEFDLQHVTMPLKEEKKYIHDLKQLRQQRDQLTSNMGSITEMDEAFDQKEQIDERFNLLKKELDSLRTEVLRTEANANAARKKYDEEQQILRVLRQQFRDADALRQKAYGQWRELKNMVTERNKHFSMYKRDQISAQSYLSSRDFEGLLSHCSKQVENVMDLWSNDDEFRTQYVKSNLNSTLWRLRTPDGRSLGPDEEPPVIQTNQFRISVPPPQQAKINESVPPATLEAKAETSEEVESFPALPAAKNDHPVKPKNPVKPPPEKSKKTETARVQDRETEIDESLNVQTKEEEELRKKEEELRKKEEELRKKEEELRKKEEELRKEEELIMKEEELRKEKAAAELKEQQRLEEIAKAKAAEERKRRQAEKAQARAEYRAQKEAEKREKKRAKQHKKKGIAAEDTTPINGVDEGIAPSSETMKELDVTAVSVAKKPPRLVASVKQFNKVQPIPLPLRKKGKRKMSTWMWVLLTVVVVVFLFLAGNYITLSTFSFQQPGL